MKQINTIIKEKKIFARSILTIFFLMLVGLGLLYIYPKYQKEMQFIFVDIDGTKYEVMEDVHGARINRDFLFGKNDDEGSIDDITVAGNISNIDYLGNNQENTNSSNTTNTEGLGLKISEIYEDCITPRGEELKHGEYILAYEQRNDNSNICNIHKRTCTNGELSGSFKEKACIDNSNQIYTYDPSQKEKFSANNIDPKEYTYNVPANINHYNGVDIQGTAISREYKEKYATELGGIPGNSEATRTVLLDNIQTTRTNGKFEYEERIEDTIILEGKEYKNCKTPRGESVYHGQFIKAYDFPIGFTNYVCKVELRFCKDGELSGNSGFKNCKYIDYEYQIIQKNGHKPEENKKQASPKVKPNETNKWRENFEIKSTLICAPVENFLYEFYSYRSSYIKRIPPLNIGETYSWEQNEQTLYEDIHCSASCEINNYKKILETHIFCERDCSEGYLKIYDIQETWTAPDGVILDFVPYTHRKYKYNADVDRLWRQNYNNECKNRYDVHKESAAIEYGQDGELYWYQYNCNRKYNVRKVRCDNDCYVWQKVKQLTKAYNIEYLPSFQCVKKPEMDPNAIPRIMGRCNKVNQHINLATGERKTDLDGVSGRCGPNFPDDYDYRKLAYCKKFYPNSISVKPYKMEFTDTRRRKFNTGGPYAAVKQSYRCVQLKINPNITEEQSIENQASIL